MNSPTSTLPVTGRFANWSVADIAAQARMQACENLDPEYSEFMLEVAHRLTADQRQVTTEREAGLREAVEPTEAMVDRAAQHLRETQQAGKRLTPWADTAKATKRKWVELAWGTLRAAMTGSAA